jgi:glycosyltransferase involved in cell wall biosynthesis
MRVAHVMAGAVHGGAELFFERLAVAQHRAGDAVLPIIRTDPARAARLRAAGLAPVELAFGGVLDWRTTPALRRALEEFSPQVAVSWMNRASAMMPRGDWVHVGRLGGYYDLRHYRRCDHLVGNTRGIVAWLRRRGWDEARTHYLPNFADDLGGAVPAEGLPPGRRLLGLGRLHTDKGFDTLLRALPQLPAAQLLLAGTGPQEGRLRALARTEGVADRVSFLGWRQDAGALLAAAEVFVCSSRVEPLGNMVIEAWSAARPVVACDADGPRELLRSGLDGILVPRERPGALAAAIKRLLGDPRARASLAASGRARFEAEFSEAPVLARWRAFLEQVRRLTEIKQ